jgi:hypothetical protein
LPACPTPIRKRSPASYSHVEKLRQLRADIDAGLRSLDEGKGKPLDIEQFIRR